MKKLLTRACGSLLLLSLVLLLSVVFASAAGNDGPVVFIKDGGVGDGTSAESPLSLDNQKYFGDNMRSSYYANKSILYQAALALSHSGGTIVLCGDISIDSSNSTGSSDIARDFIMPSYYDKKITITSVYGGVDYRQTNNARLILESPCNIRCWGDTEFTGLTICTKATASQDGSGRLIYGNGFNLTIGKDVVCKSLDKNGKEISNPTAALYPTLSAAHRYSNTLRNNPATLSVRSGTFNTIVGADIGIKNEKYGEYNGDINIIIGGDAVIMGEVYGTGLDDTCLTFGNINIRIEGGTLKGSLIAVGEGGLGAPGYTSEITITGGDIKSIIISGKSSNLRTNLTKKKYQPGLTLVNLSGLPDETATSLAKKCKNFDSVILPSSTVATAMITKQPDKTEYLAGEKFDASGMKLSISNTAEKNYSTIYNINDPGYVFTPEILTEGVTEVSVKYGSVDVGTVPVQVVSAPKIRVEGAQILVNSEKQSLRFIARVDDPKNGMEYISYGIGIIATDYISAISTGMPGATVVDRTGSKMRADAGSFAFSAAKSGIPVEEYGDEYSAFAYLTYSFGGKEYTVYSEPVSRSVYGIAETILSSGTESASVRNLLKTNVIEASSSTFDQRLVTARIDLMQGHMEDMAAVKWKSTSDADFKDDSLFTSKLQYTKNATYTGIPYIAGANDKASLQQWLDTTPSGTQYQGAYGWDTMLGNQCSSSITRALQIVTNAHKTVSSYSIAWSLPRETDTPDYYAVGEYTVPYHASTTEQVCAAQGKNATERTQIIYRSYAASRYGDFLVSTWLSGPDKEPLGHIRIINGVETVQLPNGNINGTSSRLFCTEQHSTMDKTARTTWLINYGYTFASLYNANNASAKYLPIRLSSFETGYFATPKLGIENYNTPENIKNGLTGNIRSNYNITMVKLNITDASGKSVFSVAEYPFLDNRLDLAYYDNEGKVASLPAGSYHYELTVTYECRTETPLSFDFVK